LGRDQQPQTDLFNDGLGYSSFEESSNNRIYVKQIIGNLKERDQQIVLLYLTGYTMKDIGNIMKITESRVSQIISGLREVIQDEIH